MCVRVMMILLITRRASKAPDMRSRSQRVAKSFSLSLSLSAGRTFSLRGKRFGKDFNVFTRNVSKRRVYDKKKKEGRGQPKISGEKNTSSVTLRAHLKRELLHTSPFLPFIFFSHEQSFHGRRPRAEDREEEMATDISRGTLAKKAEARRDGL